MKTEYDYLLPTMDRPVAEVGVEIGLESAFGFF
jgi:hypothetical protein